VKRLRRQFAQRVTQELGARVRRWKFIDESGVHLGLTRLYGRAAPGERVGEATPGHAGMHYTVVAALGWHGVSAPWVVEGAMDGWAFETYLKRVLAPTLRAGDIVLMDNLSVHKGESVRRMIEARLARLEFLPPYSPDRNPIEQCWSKVKTVLRAPVISGTRRVAVSEQERRSGRQLPNVFQPLDDREDEAPGHVESTVGDLDCRS